MYYGIIGSFKICTIVLAVIFEKCIILLAIFRKQRQLSLIFLEYFSRSWRFFEAYRKVFVVLFLNSYPKVWLNILQ